MNTTSNIEQERNSIIEDAKTAGFDISEFELTGCIRARWSGGYHGKSSVEGEIFKFAQLREARQSSQSEPVAWQAYDHDDGKWFTFETKEQAKEVWPNKNVIRPLYAAPQQAIPSGWKLVPIAPTDEMKQQGWEAYRDSNKPAPYNMLTDAYKAMLSAAPTAPIERDK
jgi:hypothetical protein